MDLSPLQIIANGFSKRVSAPEYGKQHQGVAPGGPMDQFSYEVGNTLLGNPSGAPALEFISAPTVRFSKDCFIVITGARYQQIHLKKEGSAEPETVLTHAQVYLAPKGCSLVCNDKSSLGFRSYLCYIEVSKSSLDLECRMRSPFATTYEWAEKNGKIRIIEGPEYPYLNDKEIFTRTYWKISNDFSEMGFRMTSPDTLPQVRLNGMISEAVADGTIQLTPKGPLVLLKHRQTVGGYPRIFNVISADVDQLGQYAPNQILQFKKVSIAEAWSIAHKKVEILRALRK